MKPDGPLAPTEIRARADALAEHVTGLRRDIHRHPELGLETPRTQSLIVSELERIGVDSIERGKACTSVIAEIRGTAPAQGSPRSIALRSDMDALPITERSEVECASLEPGRMHACGHDGHVAMLLGAAEILAAERGCFAGTVRLLFQPGEEGFGGAKLMIEEGALDGVESAFAVHLDPGYEPDVVAWRVGPMLAAFDDFTVVFRGAGGHASTPHATRDPIPAIGPFVDGLSHVAARETDPHDRVVYTVARVLAGTKENVIPHSAECAGTIRSLSVAGRELARERLSRVAAGVAAARDLDVDVEFRPGYPPTINDAGAVASVTTCADELGLSTEEMRGPFMGAEDFSYVLEKVPGAFVFLGCRTPGTGPLHSDVMKVDERALPAGVALHVAVALRLLRQSPG